MAGGGTINQLREQLLDQNSVFTASLARINARLDEFDARLLFIQSSIQTLINTFNHQIQLIQNHLKQSKENEKSPVVDLENTESKVNSVTPLHNVRIAKVPCPTFNGVDGDINRWLRKCNSFFRLYSLTEEQKVYYMSLHLDGKAESWLIATFKTLDGVSFEQFREALLSRFSRDAVDVMAEFKKLEQTGSVIDYLEKFEELQFHMLEKFPEMTETYFVHSFIAGLTDELRYSVQMFEPKTVDRAIHLARLQEAAFDSLTLKLRDNTENLQTNRETESEAPEQTVSLPIKWITHLEMQARIKRKVCGYCDELSVSGHICKKMQVYMVVPDPEEEKKSNSQLN